MHMSMKKIRILLSVTVGYASIALIIYLWISERSRLTVRLQTEDEFLLVNEKEEFHRTSPAYNKQQYQNLPFKLLTAKETANKLQISEIKRETRH